MCGGQEPGALDMGKGLACWPLFVPLWEKVPEEEWASCLRPPADAPDLPSFLRPVAQLSPRTLCGDRTGLGDRDDAFLLRVRPLRRERPQQGWPRVARVVVHVDLVGSTSAGRLLCLPRLELTWQPLEDSEALGALRLSPLQDDVRLFAFVRFTTGDAMSKRSKFALITWIGENVSGLQRAKTGTDKTLVKEVVQNFAKEFVTSDRRELEEDFIKSELKKAGGANYDAQTE
ncbi:Coactosin-like protein [Fukomys damarensis]|uniref:Coactosin-like protein n=1 Tax=Fukomys damarensis TaxID=885580 RepID=A0A091DMY6_FUKDA|nr:Coactosin-like protein [Fukomys damarensis]